MGLCTSSVSISSQESKRTSLHRLSERTDAQSMCCSASKVVVSNKNIHEYYDIHTEQKLGEGASGDVVECTHKATFKKYALKTLHKKGVSAAKLNQMKEEIGNNSRLDHPFILKMHDIFENDDNIFIVLELCTGGHLEKRLHLTEDYRFEEQEACRIIFNILTAIAHCHENDVVHRDLKMENVLFQTSSPDSPLKIIGDKIDLSFFKVCAYHLTILFCRLWFEQARER